ncbi:MAG: hypothetical protein K2P74_04590 [Nitrosomonas sp.]|nr:hypothetical protein [Nitrosomonas sp.]
MTLDDHAKQLGGLVGNFQSLEFMLRSFLFLQNGAPEGKDIYSFRVGESLPVSELTNWDSLGELIRKFNEEVNKYDLAKIDKEIVEIRDALAHGRVSACDPSDNLRLLKFDRPRNNQVKVLFNEAMTESWFVSQKKRVADAIQLVSKAMEVICVVKVEQKNEKI